MKYGLIQVKNTDNIGDDVQSYAASRFLPSIDYIIDREKLDTFQSQNREPVSVIMNGWYLYNRFHWPPASEIRPLWISLHLDNSGNFDYLGIGDRFLDGIGGEYLKQFTPIGVRDESTQALLQKKGIESYISGCMTLTLELEAPVPRGNEILLVDMNPQEERMLREAFPEEHFVSVTHNVNPAEHAIRTLEERFSMVENLLTRYKQAKCVITNRLHCALPCLALHTPVVMVYEEAFADRIGSFLKLLHYCNKERMLDYFRGEYDLSNPPENSNAFYPIKKALEEKCRAFLSSAEDMPRQFPYSQEDVLQWQKALLTKAEADNRTTYLELQSWIRDLETAKIYLESQANTHKARIQELESWSGTQQNTIDALNAQLQEKEAGMDCLSSQIAELQQWNQEQSAGKTWLEEQCNCKDVRIASLESWGQKLSEGQQWLENQCQEKDNQIARLQAWNQELSEGKQWLENQRLEKDSQISNLQVRSQELEQAKQWLETQNQNKDIRITELEDQVRMLTRQNEHIAAELSNERAHHAYTTRKLNQLREDNMIQIVIKLKHYEL